MVFGHGDLINNIRLCWNCKTGMGEEVPGGTDPRSIPDYFPKDARQRSPMSSFIFREAALHSGSEQANMLEPDYCQVRLVEIGVGRRFWQSNPSAENAHAFYVRVVKLLRRSPASRCREKRRISPWKSCDACGRVLSSGRVRWGRFRLASQAPE